MLAVFIYSPLDLIHGYSYFFFSLWYFYRFVDNSYMYLYKIYTHKYESKWWRNSKKYDCWQLRLIKKKIVKLRGRENVQQLGALMLQGQYKRAWGRCWYPEVLFTILDVFFFFCVEILDTIHTIWSILLIDSCMKNKRFHL